MPAAAEDDPFAWLVRTDQALATRNYEGVFVHEHAGESETLRVIHRVGNDGVYERLLSMDGSGREFIRKGSQLTCYLPDQRTVLVEKSNDAGVLLGSLPKMETVSAGIYQVGELQKTRVSGRAAHLIAVTPMDQMRYGYRVWIDDATAMPLKTQLRDGKGQVIEQIVFTDLRLPVHIADSELQPSVDAHNYRWVQHLVDSADSRGLSVSWEASLLPPGFHMTVDARQVLRSGPVEHLVFSDGLASVSVFVDIGRESVAASGTEDAATIGSSSAYSTVVQGYRVTAVGEVPPDTVRAIAQSIRTSSPANSTSLLGLGLAAEPARRGLQGNSIFDDPTGHSGPDTRIDGSAPADARAGLGPIRSPGMGAPTGFGAAAAAGAGRH